MVSRVEWLLTTRMWPIPTYPHTYMGSQVLIEQMRPLSLVNNSMHVVQMKLGYEVYYLGTMAS